MHLQPSRRLFNHAHCNERKALQANYCGATAYRLPQDIFHEQNWKNHCPVNQHRAQFLDKSRSCASSTLLCNLGNTTHTHFIPRAIYLWSWRRKKSTEKYDRRFLWCQMLIRKKPKLQTKQENTCSMKSLGCYGLIPNVKQTLLSSSPTAS